MASPFKNIDKAFDLLYDEEISILTKDGNRTSLMCIVFLDNTGDVLTSDMVETDRQDIQILVKKEDWVFIEQNVRVGDTVYRIVDGRNIEYSVSGVQDDFSMGKTIKARTIG